MSAYDCGRISTIPTVGTSSSRVKLRISSVNCMQYMCCVLARVKIRELRKVVFLEDMKRRFLCQHNPNTAFTFIAPV
jgi:hypothetical protein